MSFVREACEAVRHQEIDMSDRRTKGPSKPLREGQTPPGVTGPGRHRGGEGGQENAKGSHGTEEGAEHGGQGGGKGGQGGAQRGGRDGKR
jgi:hypothetical protein